MLNSRDFAKRLEKILDFYGLSASALAEEMDFNRSTISHLISGRNKPSLDFVMKLLQKYPEVDMDWLVLGRGSFPPETGSNSATRNLKAQPATKNALPPDLFSQAVAGESLEGAINSHQKSIARIAIFFTDGTFEVYNP